MGDRIEIGSRSDPDRSPGCPRQHIFFRSIFSESWVSTTTYILVFLTPSECMRPLYAAALVSLAVTLLVLWYAKTHVERVVEEKKDALKKKSWVAWMCL